MEQRNSPSGALAGVGGVVSDPRAGLRDRFEHSVPVQLSSLASVTVFNQVHFSTAISGTYIG